eukprot:scaffold51081_cov18-Tisochrysis_lutea.AAC.1
MQAPPLLPYSFAPTTSAHIFNALKHINAMQNSYGQVEEMHKCMQYGGGRVYSQKLSTIPDNTTSHGSACCDDVQPCKAHISATACLLYCKTTGNINI